MLPLPAKQQLSSVDDDDLWFILPDIFTHFFSILFPVFLWINQNQNTRELAAHRLPGMICSGELSGAKITCSDCFNAAMPQKGGVISICRVHSHWKDFQICPIVFVQIAIAFINPLVNCKNDWLIPFNPDLRESLLILLPLLHAVAPSNLLWNTAPSRTGIYSVRPAVIYIKEIIKWLQGINY